MWWTSNYIPLFSVEVLTYPRVVGLDHLAPDGPHVGPMNLAVWEKYAPVMAPSVNTQWRQDNKVQSEFVGFIVVGAV